jgi:hypothetical protein
MEPAMKAIITSLLFGLLALHGTVDGQLPALTGNIRPLKLPMDPDQIVLQLDYSGGFQTTLPDGFEPTPRLRVFADGRVITGQNRPDQAVFEIRLEEDQLLEEMRKIVEVEKFLELDQAVIAEAIADTGRPITLVDGTVTRIEVRLDDREHAIELYALGFCASAYPEVAGLPELRRIELIGQRLCALARLGGPERLEACLVHAQEVLDSQGRGVRVAADHLSSAVVLPDGGTQVRLVVPGIYSEAEVVLGCVVEVELDAAGQHRSTSTLPDEAPYTPQIEPIR